MLLKRRMILGLLASTTLAVVVGSTGAGAAGFTATVGTGHLTVPDYITGSGPNSYVVPSWGTLETFEETNGSTGADDVGNWAFGTVTQADYEILPGNEYGGASPIEGSYGGSYLAAYGDTNTRVKLNTPSNYMGFFWTGGEAGDSIKVYSKGTLVGEFNTSDPAFDALIKPENNCGVECATYNQGGSTYAYVTLQAPNGVLFDEIEFGGFVLELDNFFVGNTPNRFAPAEQELTEVVSREEMAIDYGLYGLFGGMNTACRSFGGGSQYASNEGAKIGESSVVPTADVAGRDERAGSDFCVSVSSMGATVSDGTSELGLSVALGVRLAEYLRVGAGVSTQLMSEEPGDYSYDQTLPLVSAFVELGSAERTGLKLRAAIAARSGDLTYDREDIASGTGDLTSWGASADLSYGFLAGPSMIISSFVGVKYVNSSRDEYSDDTGVTRVSYEEVENEATYLRGGLAMGGMLSDSVAYSAVAGVNYQLSGSMDDFVGYESGIEFRTASTRTNETLLFGDFNLAYQVSESSAVNLGVGATQVWEEDEIGYTANIGYTVGF